MKTEPEKQEKTTTLSQVIELTCEYLGHEDRTRETRKTTTLSQVIELTCEYLGHEDRTRETRENNNPVTSNRVNM